MHAKSIQTLEFPKVLARLAEYTSFSAGRERALALQPSSDFAEVVQRQEETHEAMQFLDLRGSVSLGGARDVRPLAEHATRGIVLTTTELLDIRGTLTSARMLRRTITKLAAQFPRLAAIADRIDECSALEAEIARCINDRGEIIDLASPELARIRREIAIAHDRLMDRLQRLIASPISSRFLQEPIITERDGRYVIPIKADFKGRIPGIVHDTSASGATLFIEPLATVELNNRWRELRLAETHEVERILRELTALVAEQAEAIVQNVETLADLDLAFAKAKYAHAIRATMPELKRRPIDLKLVAARHPLLDPATVVPIDVHLGDDFFILVITGPNTGGKTVTLKTIGLLSAMAQSGLHIPAMDGSAVPMFSSIYADIGDEQSIEQSLSTFSSHMTNIVEILHQADARSLVLLDEIGAGTDPVEGSALARAILAHLRERGIATVVATHYSELKVYAHVTPGLQNACVEFDDVTLRPTYHLTIGLPGRSNAFAIAQRLGLTSDIVQQARGWMSTADLEAESLLGEIKRARGETLAAREAAKQAQAEAERVERELRAQLAEIESTRADILNRTREQAREELANVRRKLRELSQQVESTEAMVAAREELAAIAEEVAPVEPPPIVRRPLGVGEPIRPGDWVRVAGLDRDGEVVALVDGEVEVQVGHFRVRARPETLERVTSSVERGTSSVPILHTPPSTLHVPMELSLRGLRAEEALLQLEKYLDRAYLAGLPWVRIVHGKGTGTLRQLVRERLAEHPLVASYRPAEPNEGGEGVTVVEFLK
jgi:DNA mismatch repair protein MutS2